MKKKLLFLQVEYISFFVVHVLAMTSTITNPILYGWLNANLKHLFRAMIPHIRLATITSGQNNSGGEAAPTAGLVGPTEAREQLNQAGDDQEHKMDKLMLPHNGNASPRTHTEIFSTNSVSMSLYYYISAYLSEGASMVYIH